MTDTDPNMTAFIRALHDDPFDAATKLVFADWLEEHGDDPARAAQLRKGLVPLTGFDEVAVADLASCRFAPATWDKRFARSLYDLCTEERPHAVTPRQYCWLWVTLRRYRKSVRTARVKTEAEERYDRYVKLLDLAWLKPAQRQRQRKTDDRITLFD